MDSRRPPVLPGANAWTCRYVNVLTGKQSEDHPLGHIYSRLAKRAERLNFKRQSPDATSPEAWMEFVEPSGTPYYYCFLTRKREYEFPKLLPVGMVNAIAVKTDEATHVERLRTRMLQRPKRRLSPGSLEAMRVNLEAEQESKPRRAAFLAKSPLPVSHIVFTAQYLGIDTLTQTHLMWIASAALCDTLTPTLPVGWEQQKATDPKSQLTHYYCNMSLRTSQWEHPSLTHWRSVLHEILAFERKTLGYDPLDSQHSFLGAIDDQRDPSKPLPKKAMLWVPASD